MPTINKNTLSYSVSCQLCGEQKQLDDNQVEYARRFGTVAGLYICKKCRTSIRWLNDNIDKIDSLISRRN